MNGIMSSSGEKETNKQTESFRNKERNIVCSRGGIV
jgi:hypothetical protein